jgi:hypothetical protein
MGRRPNFSSGACAIATVLLAHVLPVAAAELQPGLWEISSKTERNGIAAAEQSKTSCLGPEQSKKLAEMSPRPERLNEGCETVDAQKTRDGFSIQMRCAGIASVDSTTLYVFENPRHFTGTMKSTVTIGQRVVTNTLTVEGRLIGECPR